MYDCFTGMIVQPGRVNKKVLLGGTMQFKRILACLLVSVMATACTCRPHTKSGDSSDNIGYAEADGPLKDIHFAFDSSSLSGQSKEILKNNADWLAQNKSKRIQVEGHCDERGTNEYNMALGARRAHSAFEYLRSLGVDSSRMSKISYGEEMPLDPAHNEDAWAKNRRDHFKVLN